MCGRYTLTVEAGELRDAFGLEELPEDLPPRFNIAPSQPVPVITNRNPKKLELFRWGLIPSWAKDMSVGYKMINARVESLADKPAFKKALQKRRCLVIADGFYEWKKIGKRKQPMYVRLKSHEAFGFAGLWESWHAPDGQRILSCTIITQPAKGEVREVHDRMPVIVTPEMREAWLDPEPRDPDELLALLGGVSADELELHPVSTLVNSPANELPECIVPVAESEHDDPQGRLLPP